MENFLVFLAYPPISSPHFLTPSSSPHFLTPLPHFSLFSFSSILFFLTFFVYPPTLYLSQPPLSFLLSLPSLYRPTLPSMFNFPHSAGEGSIKTPISLLPFPPLFFPFLPLLPLSSPCFPFPLLPSPSLSLLPLPFPPSNKFTSPLYKD